MLPRCYAATAHGYAAHRQIAAEVCLNKNADGIPAPMGFSLS